MAKHQRATIVPFSSIVGSSVLIHDENGVVVCQLGILGVGGQDAAEWKTNQMGFAEEVAKAINAHATLLKVHTLAEELCGAVDSAALDIGGSRPTGDIIADLGPATDLARAQLR